MRVRALGFVLALACHPCLAESISNGFDYPVGKPFVTEANDGDGYYNFQDFGVDRHLGEDWNGESGGNTDWGDPVYAVSHGQIVSARNEGPGWGNVVIIEHSLTNGPRVRSMYAHLDAISKFSGDVLRGEKIGTIGRGYFYGRNPRGQDVYDYPAHLHFEIRSVCPPVGEGYGSDTSSRTDPSQFIDARRELAQTTQPLPWLDELIFRSGILGVVGQPVAGTVALDTDQFLGAQFHLDGNVRVTHIGGHMLGGPTPLVFGSIVRLSSASALPSGSPFDSSRLATVTFNPGRPSSDFRAALPISLGPGDYALVFGCVNPGFLATCGGMPTNNGDFLGSSYFFWNGSNWQSELAFSNARFVVCGRR